MDTRGEGSNQAEDEVLLALLSLFEAKTQMWEEFDEDVDKDFWQCSTHMMYIVEGTLLTSAEDIVGHWNK